MKEMLELRDKGGKKVKSDIGLIGLAVMGENLVMNMESKGFCVTVYNRTYEKVERFLTTRAKGKNIVGAKTLQELVDSLKKPRKIMMMIKAGSAVDSMIDMLCPLLEKGDIIIDGGNSNFHDTIRRTQYVEEKGLYYIGTGVSGGEEGALKGPSMMPGGSEEAWQFVKPVFQSICAKVNGEPCCDWVGKGGSGHFVKMVHNGIEYGDMQIICEVYDIMKRLLGMSTKEIGEVFSSWNKGFLNSYLIEITANILQFRDENGEYVVENILDCAGQKGTGKWTSISSLDEGMNLSLITESVYARCLSALKEERVCASEKYPKTIKQYSKNKMRFLKCLENALIGAKIVSYAQGFSLIRAASLTYDWKLDYGKIALMWRGGCIIRSTFLGDIKKAFDVEPDLHNLLMNPFFAQKIKKAEKGWRKVVAESIMQGVAVPALSAALEYFDGYTSENLPANLLQAQRDYFGAHMYERKDRPRGEMHHTNWTGEGGETSSSIYNV